MIKLTTYTDMFTIRQRLRLIWWLIRHPKGAKFLAKDLPAINLALRNFTTALDNYIESMDRIHGWSKAEENNQKRELR